MVGSSCSGKTTLARGIADQLGVPHIELDAIHWLPNWQERPTEDFRKLVESAVACDLWVSDGNYRAVRDIVWGRATTVVWLNYSFPLVFYRALTRTLARSITRRTLFSGNKESLRQAFLSKESILWWVITTYRLRKRQYREVFKSNDFPHMNFIEIRTSRQAGEFLKSLQAR